MIYSLEFTAKAKKQFEKMDKYAQEQIGRYLDKHFGDAPSNPRLSWKTTRRRIKGLLAV